jgi:hypothetical protein
MTQGLYLHGLGITADRNAATYTLVGLSLELQPGKEFAPELGNDVVDDGGGE